MRMRRKKNLVPRMERCAAYQVKEPEAMRGRWKDLYPQAEEIWVEMTPWSWPWKRLRPWS